MNEQLKDVQKVLTLYATSLRNVGLFTTISFACLGYSRFYRKKNKYINVLLILLSIVITINVLFLTHYLLSDINTIINSDPETFSSIPKWLIVPKSMLIISYILLATGLYILYNQLTN